MDEKPSREEVIRCINEFLKQYTYDELAQIWIEFVHDANTERSEELCGINYTCLGDYGDFDVGERFSGGGTVSKSEGDQMANIICNSLCSTLKEAIHNPPMCIMLHIQTTPPEKRRKLLEEVTG